MSNSSKSTTMHISGEKKYLLDKLAFQASIKAGRMISWTELANYTIDHYVEEAVKDLMHSTEEQPKKNMKK